MHNLSKASYGTTPEHFSRCLRLALQADETPVKKKRFTALLLAALLILALAGAAMAAITLSRSPEALARQRARGLLGQAYGIPQDFLSLFNERVQELETGWAIDYHAYAFETRLGQYHVSLPKEGEAAAFWTYDGGDLAGLRGLGLDSPVWGGAQIERLLTLTRAHEEKRAEMTARLGPEEGWPLEERAALDEMLLAEPGGRELFLISLSPETVDISQAEARSRSREAVAARYGIPEETLAGYDVMLWLRSSPVIGVFYSALFYYGEDARYARDSFSVTLDATTGDVVSCIWDVEPADRYLPEGPLHAYADAVAEYIDAGSLGLIADDAQREELASRIAQAGLDGLPALPAYATPGPGALPMAEAQAMARATLGEAYGLTEELLALFEEHITYEEREIGPLWAARYTPAERADWDLLFAERMGEYHVLLAAEITEWTEAIVQKNPGLSSDRVVSVFWTLDGASGGADSAQKLGEAPAWDAALLPQFMELLLARAALPKPADATAWEERLRRRASADQLMRDAGFDAWLFDAGYPGEGEISCEEAMRLLKAALAEEFGPAGEMAAEWPQYPAFTLLEGGLSEWRFNLSPESEAMEAYYVRLDGRTGEILELVHDEGMYR